MAAKRKSRKIAPKPAAPDPKTQMWVAENTSRILKGPAGLRGAQWANPVDYYVRLADKALAPDEDEQAPGPPDTPENS